MTAVDETPETVSIEVRPRPDDAVGATAVSAGSAGSVVGPTASGPWWLRHRLAVLGMTLVALLGVGSVAVHQYQDQQNRLVAIEVELARTQGRVQATRAELRTTVGVRVDAEATLDETLAQLAEIEDQLAANRDELGVTTGERDEILAAVGSLASELGTTLDGVQANVDRVDLQGDQVAGLDVCLDGVNQAMNRQAVGNQLAAAAALSEVADTCDLTILSIALSLEDAS